MTQTTSTMMALGTKAPYFSLQDTYENTVSLSDFDQAEALLVMFICNHCPFVKHIREQLASIGAEYQERGVGVAAIMSNDIAIQAADSPDKMQDEVRLVGYTFPYLYDEKQEVAKAYHATCTPDFFLFNKERNLVYRGQLDDARPTNNEQVTGADLRTALDALLSGRPIPASQKPSIGCNIKWKPGNEPDYFFPAK